MPVFFQGRSFDNVSCPFLNLNITNISLLPDITPWVKLCHVNSGKVELTVSDKKYSADANDFILIMPREVYSLNSESSDVTILNIPVFSGKGDVDLLKYKTLSPIIRYSTPLNREISDYFSLLLKESKGKEKGYSYMTEGLAHIILSSIIRSDAIAPCTDEEIRRSEADLSLIKTVKEYIREKYMDGISLESTSEYCSLSIFYFSHQFKKIMGITYYDYLTAYRLDRAIDMLADPKAKITDISPLCGFATVRTFNRSFKGFFGCSPTDYFKSLK